MKRVIKCVAKIIINTLTVIVIGLACYGGFKIYKNMSHRPEIQVKGEVKEEMIRVKLEGLGQLKVATSEQRYKESIMRKGLLGKSENIIDLVFKADYCYNFKDVEIATSDDRLKVIFKINLDKLFLDKIGIVKDDGEERNKGLILSTPDERFLRDILNKKKTDAFDKVKVKFLQDEEFKSLAIDNIRQTLITLAKDLGFDDITILTDGGK